VTDVEDLVEAGARGFEDALPIAPFCGQPADRCLERRRIA
jgi:hypothetical protein